MTAPRPALAADLTAGLKRLKMAGMRRLAPELLVTAKTQRWNPEDFLRTLVEAEIAARDESNARTRRRQACFPVSKTLEEFDLAASPIPEGHLRLPRQPRMGPSRRERLPDRTSRDRQKPPAPRARIGRRRCRAPCPLLQRRRPGRHPLPRLADNSVGKIIDGLLRNDLIILDELGFAPLDDTGAQLLFRFVAAAYERRSSASAPTGRSNPGAGSSPNTPPRSACSTASSTTATWSSPTATATA